VSSGDPFEYALLRAVPRIERGECLNVGLLLYCQGRDFLGVRTRLDADRLRAIDPGVDVQAVGAALSAVEEACAVAPSPAREDIHGSRGARFRWLVAPRSTIVQTSEVHAGVTDDPIAELERLFARLVA
jgi:hypothetical protein